MKKAQTKTQEQTTVIKQLTESEQKETKKHLTGAGLIKLYNKTAELEKLDKEKQTRRITAINYFIAEHLNYKTLQEVKNKETALTILHNLDNLYLSINGEFSNLLRNACLLYLYANNKCYDDYRKPHTLLTGFNNRKLFISLQNQLLNSNYFVTNYSANVQNNFTNGTTVTTYDISLITLRPLIEGNATRETLQEQGITFFDKVKETEEEKIEHADRRQQAYDILMAEGLQDLLN